MKYDIVAPYFHDTGKERGTFNILEDGFVIAIVPSFEIGMRIIKALEQITPPSAENGAKCTKLSS